MKIDELNEMCATSVDADIRKGPAAPTLQAVASEANLLRAWERVRRNNGAAGVDHVAIADLEPQFPGLAQPLAQALLAGSYRAKPVLRVEIPKPSGGTRKLGIPAVMDRLVHQAVLQVLQPIFDPLFSRQSFAYRPGRGPLDAVRHIQQRLSPRSGWILHFDVEDFFDSVPHDRVFAALSSKVNDPALLSLVRDALTCGVFDRGHVIPTVQGIAQGSPLSPLLANAVLDAADQWLEARGALFARYADDCAVLTDTYAEGERLKHELEQFISTHSLRLNPKKTTLTPAHQAEFLGFTYREGRHGKFHRIISPESLADYRNTVEERLQEKSSAEFNQRIASAATLLTSWLGYFGATEERKQIEEVLAVTEDALRMSEWHRWSGAVVRQRNLTSRNVPERLAQEASQAADGSEIISESLRVAFPSTFFQQHGLGPLGGNGKPGGLSRFMEYNGRLSPEIEASEKGNAVTFSTEWCDRSWSLIRSDWLGVSLQLIKHRRALLPRISGVNFQLGKHQVFFHW